MARPRKVLDPKQIEALAAISVPADEIAILLDISQRTIHRRFGSVVKRGHAKCKERIRSLLFKHALGGNAAAAIFLAKAVCGMREQEAAVINVSATASGGQIIFSEETKKQLEDFHVALQRRVYQRTHCSPASSNGDASTQSQQQPALN